MPKKKMVSKYVYSCLIGQFKCINIYDKWANYLHSDINVSNWFVNIERLTIDNVLRSFQFKLLHRIIFFNDKLYSFKLVQSKLCNFCMNSDDSIEHSLWTCIKSTLLWSELTKWYEIITGQKIILTYSLVI